MRDIIKMVVVLTVICVASAFALSFVNNVTKAPREYQLLKFVQEPSIKAVLSGYDNDPVKDLIKIPEGKDEKGKEIFLNVFPAKKDGKVFAVAYAAAARGYHDLIDVMVGINKDAKITGISIMTHSETPGLGARVVEPKFTSQFKGLDLGGDLNLTGKGGKVEGITGATFSSTGVVNAVRKAMEEFPKIKKEVFGS